jgi:hypothetical protein
MNTAIKKAAVGKTLRVATVFTGAAACAAAFTPAAMAATGHPARPQNGAAYDSMKVTSNCAGVPNWLHLTFWWSSKPGPSFYLRTMCWGFAGIDAAIPPQRGGTNRLSYECGGNNYGYLNPATDFQNFGPGTGYRHENNFVVNSVEITGWSGTDRCPVGPAL